MMIWNSKMQNGMSNEYIFTTILVLYMQQVQMLMINNKCQPNIPQS
jgi:hypothetical protein